MNERIKQLEDKVKELETVIAGLSNSLSFKGSNFEELVRDTVIFDRDTNTRTQDYNVVSGGTLGKIVAPKTPTYYVKSYFRGTVIYIPVFTE